MLKKILAILFLFFAFIVAAAIAFAYFYEDEVKKYAIQSLNNQLKAEVNVGNVHFSVLKTFPLASLEFKDVSVMENWQKTDRDTLLHAKSIFLKFNVWDIYNRTYKVKEVEIQNAKINLKVDEAGTENYNFWKASTTDNGQQNNLSFQLEKVTTKNVQLFYESKQNQFVANLILNKTQFAGDFQKSVFSANIQSNFVIEKLSKNNEDIFAGREITIEGEIEVDTKSSVYKFQKTSLGVDGIAVLIDGYLKTGEESFLEIAFSGKDIAFKNALALLKDDQKNFLADYEISGKANLQGTLIGSLDGKVFPKIDLAFDVKDASINKPKSQISLQNIDLNGNYSNGENSNKNSSSIVLQKFSADLGKGSIEGNFKLENFEKLFFTVNGKMNIQLTEISDLFDFKNLEDLAGSVSVNVKSTGRLQSIDKISVDDWKKANSIGRIVFEGVSFKLTTRPQHFKEFSGDLKIVNNSILAERFTGDISSSDFSMNGKFINLIGFLLDENEALLVDADFSSDHLELNELLLKNGSKSEKSSEEDYHFGISERIHVKLDAQIGHLAFKKFSFKNCSSHILIQNQVLIADNIHFESMEGSVDGKLKMDASKEDFILMESESSSKKINVKQLFHDMDNFGQQMVTSANIDGIASANIHFTSKWSPDLELDQSSLILESSFLIEKGRLINFEPLKKLSKYISLEELNDIRFSTLQNSILIKDEKIHIPEFEIRSSAMDLSLEGTHTFDNKVNYRLELIVEQLLGMKIKKPKKQVESEFGYIEDDGLGRSKLFLKMSGDLDNPTISYDTEQLKEHWKEEIGSEKKEIKKILKDEFGIFKKDSNQEMQEIDTEKVDEKKEPFQIEWGEKEESQNEEKKLEASRSVNRKEKKSAFNKFFDKIAVPNQDEFIQPNSE